MFNVFDGINYCLLDRIFILDFSRLYFCCCSISITMNSFFACFFNNSFELELERLLVR